MSGFFAGVDDEVRAKTDGAKIDEWECQEDEQNEEDNRRFSNRSTFVASCFGLASCHFLVPWGGGSGRLMPASYAGFVTNSGRIGDTFVARRGHFRGTLLAFLWHAAEFDSLFDFSASARISASRAQ